MTDVRLQQGRGSGRRGDLMTFRLLVALTYPLFLVAAIAARLSAIGRGTTTEETSVFSRALTMSEATFGFAFMG